MDEGGDGASIDYEGRRLGHYSDGWDKLAYAKITSGYQDGDKV